MSTGVCSKCGREMPPGTRFCGFCGGAASIGRYCRNCGESLQPMAYRCPKCGTEVHTPSEQELSNYAGFWRRFAALIVDGLVLLIPNILVQALFRYEGIAYLFSGLIAWLYYALMESSEKQATLGKAALGLIVTDSAGDRISFGRATGRYFGKIISGLILCIGYIMAGFTEKKQALHDMMANTLVVVKNA